MPFLLLLLLLYTIPPTSSEEYQYKSCIQNFSCGNVTATFPFWGGLREFYCGLPSFNLICDNGQPKILMQQQEKLRILSFNQQQRTMKVLRDDFSNTLCPPRIISTPQIINYTTFPLLGKNNSVLAIYYGCTSSVDEDQSIVSAPVICSNSSAITVWASVGDDPNIRDDRCDSTVVIPVEGGSEQGLSSSIAREVDKGFTLGWVYNGFYDDYCERCVNSSGVCGGDTGDGEVFSCFCPDGVRANYTCPPGISANTNRRKVKKSKSVPLIVGLAVGASTMAAAITSFTYYILRLRKPKPHHQKQLNPFFTPSTTQEEEESEEDKEDSKSIISSTHMALQLFSYTDLQQSTNNFHPSKQLGEGGFGIVYHGRLKDGREIAVKRLFERNFKGLEQFINEVEILTRLRHPNLVTLYGCTSRRSRDLLLVYEYVSNGTLSDHLRRPDNTLSWPRRLSVAAQTAGAVAYLHATDIIHRDIKTNNILLDSNFNVKVADFGISRLFPTDVTHVSTAPQGTPGYVDPEYYHCYHLTEKSDVYSFGVVLVELLSSKPAVDLGRKRHDINLANMALSRIQSQSLEELVDTCLGFKTDMVVREGMTVVAELAFRCLQAEREMRPCMDEVVEVLNGIDGGEGDRGESPFSMRDNLDWATSVSSSQSVVGGGLRNEFGVNTM